MRALVTLPMPLITTPEWMSACLATSPRLSRISSPRVSVTITMPARLSSRISIRLLLPLPVRLPPPARPRPSCAARWAPRSPPGEPLDQVPQVVAGVEDEVGDAGAERGVLRVVPVRRRDQRADRPARVDFGDA